MTPTQEKPRAQGWFDRLVDLTGISVGVATFLIGLFVAYDVIARTVFLMTNSWTTEVTMYLMGYITFVGAAFALKEGSHVSVDLLVQKLRPGPRRHLLLLMEAVLLVIFALLAWLSFWFFMEAWDSGEVSDTLLSIKLWIPYFFFFIGAVWLLLVLLVLIYRQWQGRVGKEGVHG